MFEMLNNFSLVILDVICCRIYFDSLFVDSETNNRRRSYIYLFIFGLMSLIINKVLINNLLLKEISIVLLMTIIMYFLKKVPLWKTFAASIFFLIILIVVDLVTLYTINAFFKEFDVYNIGNTVAGRLMVVIEKIWLLLAVLFMKTRADKRKGRGMVETEWLRFIFFPIFTIIISIAMIVVFNEIQDLYQANVLYTTAFGLVIMNVFIYYLIDDIIEREISIKDRELEYAQFKNQVDVYKTLEECLERQQQYAHEFKNHIICVDNLVKDRDYVTLEKYISELNDSEYIERNSIDTNNTIANTILNEKYHEMINKGIVFVFRINDLSTINIEEEDLVVILSNMLNNAIEACEKCPEEKIIKLKFITEDDMIILSVKNTCSEPVIYENGVYKTSKIFNKNEHGIGIRNIQRTIEKYGGTYSIRHSQNEFYFSILFPFEQNV